MSHFRFIAAEQAQHAVALLCRVLEVSRSGFYAWYQRKPSRQAQANALLIPRVRAIHAASRGTYGAPRVHASLQIQGQRVGRQRVARLMRQDALVGRGRRRHRVTTIADRTATIPDRVRRQFTRSAINTVWFADITYIGTDEGWLYLATILDACSRRIVGWAFADHLRTELATDALNRALESRAPAPGLIHHSDRGSQYTSHAYGERLDAAGAWQSLGNPGTCWDNAVAESFFATLKTELLHRQRWTTRQAAKSAIFEYIEGFYNPRRLHSTLGYLSPCDFEGSLPLSTQIA